MGCCIRNCYGTDLDEVKTRTREVLPNMLLDFLLDLSKCSNSQSQKNGLANWNKLVAFVTKEVFDKINDLDKTNGYLDLSSPGKIFESILKGLIDEFNDLMCNGGSSDLDNLDKNNNGDGNGGIINKFPPMSDLDRDKIKDLIDDNNFFDDNASGSGGNGNNGNGNGSIVVDSDDMDNNGNGSGENGDGSNGSGSDDGLNGDGSNGSGSGNNGNNNGNGSGGNGSGNGNGSGGPLDGITNEELEDLNFNRKLFKCFAPVFNANNYIFKTEEPLFITTHRLKMVKRIHNEILLPIFNFYFGKDAAPTCQMHILMCLASHNDIIDFAGGGAFSKHLSGEAVDFTVAGIDTKKIIQDIRNKTLNINFGVLHDAGGSIHATLPYTFENLDVRRMYLYSPEKENTSLEIEFI